MALFLHDATLVCSVILQQETCCVYQRARVRDDCCSRVETFVLLVKICHCKQALQFRWSHFRWPEVVTELGSARPPRVLIRVCSDLVCREASAEVPCLLFAPIFGAQLFIDTTAVCSKRKGASGETEFFGRLPN